MPEEPLGYVIKRLRLRIRRLLDNALEAHGLSASSFEALFHINRGSARTAAELSRTCDVTPQTMHRLVRGLKKRDYLREEGTEGRAILLGMTARGKSVVEAAWKDVEPIEQRMIRGLNAEDIRLLRDLLLRCVDSLEPEKDSIEIS